jgi:phage repressor protein C with HTH and peptisase S24 domain
MPENAGMEEKQTTGAKVREMMARAGFSVRQFASRSGYATGSGVQRIIDPDFDKQLTIDVAKRIAEAFAGTPVSPEEIWALAGLTAPNGRPVELVHSEQDFVTRDVPIYGTALGGVIHFDTVAVEQTSLTTGEIVQYIARPPVLKGRKDVYGVYVQGSSMAPRYQDGELVFVDPRRPPMIGDDVIVFLRDEDGNDGEQVTCCLVKRLVKRTASAYRLEQFTPAGEFDVPAERVWKVQRVIPFSELFS